MRRLHVIPVLLFFVVCLTLPAQAVDMGEILSAETRTGSITNPSQTDSFTFLGQIGDSVVIGMSAESGGLDPQIFLYDPYAALETSEYCGDYCDHSAIHGWKLLQSGLYTIVVKDYNGNETGDYSLSFLSMPGPTVSPQDPDGGDILSGETRTGAGSPRADTDAYTFDAEAGQAVVIDMSATSGGLDPQIFLYDPSGILEESAYCGDYCDHSAIDGWVLLQTGLYTIVVRDYNGNETGDYTLSFSKVPGPQLSPAVRLSLNQTELHLGNTLIVTAHVSNGSLADSTQVEGKAWITLPGGSQMSILNPHFTFTVAPGVNITKEIFKYTFGAGQPAGTYNVGARFIDPVSGREISVNVKAFVFTP